MQIAVLTFDQFNEIDSFVAANLLNRMRDNGWRAWITAAEDRVVSRSDVTVLAEKPLEFAQEADAVIVGSGMRTDAIARDDAILRRIKLDPARQLIAAQCSGALILARLGLLTGGPACTDQYTRPVLEAAGVEALVDTPFNARGNVATAGGCLSAPYIAAWMVARRLGFDAAAAMLDSAAPVGEAQSYVAHALAVVRPFVARKADAA